MIPFSHSQRSLLIRITRTLAGLLMIIPFYLHVDGQRPIPFLTRFDQLLYDLRLRTTAEAGADARIAIIDIDEKSLAQEGRWPWSREKISLLADILFDYYDIQLLAFDMVFSERDDSINVDVAETLLQRILEGDIPRQQALNNLRAELTGDARLAEVIRNRPVVLGYFFSNQAGDNTPGQLPPPLPTGSEQAFIQHVIAASGYGANRPELQAAATAAGFFNNPSLKEGDDGVLRQIPLLIHHQGQLYESLSIAVLRTLMKQHDLRYQTEKEYGDQRLEAISLANLTIPVDKSAGALVPFRARTGVFHYHSATDVLNAQVDPKQLKGKIALIGATATGLSELYATPVGINFPGVEVHATLIAGALDHRFKSRPAFMQGWELIEIILVGLIGVWLFHALQAGAMTLTFMLSSLLLAATHLLLWTQLNYDSRAAAPMTLLALLYALQLFFGYLFEIRRKKHLSDLFGHYVPPELVEQMSQSDQEYSIGGESREMTVLFSDIRGFTTLSEQLAPDQLCELINEIFTEITREIHHHGGTIDKYMGDAVMAFWGAPIHSPDHASQAVTTALALNAAVQRLDRAFRQQGRPGLQMGIGLNSGSMSVGNMGSQFRMAYTVVGDAVNLASRLEGVTKNYGVDTIVSQYTREAAAEFLYRPLDRIRVKGKQEPITIYQPLCPLDQADDAMKADVQLLEQAQVAYQQQQWDQAEALFRELQQQQPDDPIYPLYLRRISEYRASPPGAAWDGVHTFTTK